MPSRSEKRKGEADLHVHTAFSDGVLLPEKVVEKALGLGLRAIAVTDHDCVDGIAPSVSAAEGTTLEIIPGVEISAAAGDREIHVLGYFIEPRDPGLLKTLQKMKHNRMVRMRGILANLKKRGVSVDEDKVFANSGEGTLGRMHLARVLKEEGVVRNTWEAFDKFLGDGRPCHIKHKRLDYRKCIELILGAGGVPVLAHPATMGSDEYIPAYISAGLRGIEAYHSKHRPSASRKYCRMCGELGLIATGGSDCHGVAGWTGEIMLGKVTVPYGVVENLREEAVKVRGSRERLSVNSDK
ncbi:MAG: PHP domain-containing protein [Candidatus Omnitrophica bacterium]|nr:PHP domain-containing protein [Candidatus Omnitrophota bacterium]